jgi:hypothetical protein
LGELKVYLINLVDVLALISYCDSKRVGRGAKIGKRFYVWADDRELMKINPKISK